MQSFSMCFPYYVILDYFPSAKLEKFFITFAIKFNYDENYEKIYYPIDNHDVGDASDFCGLHPDSDG